MEAQLKTVIDDGVEELQKTLGRMQKFNANFSGSKTCFVRRRKELEALMEQEVVFTTWFTLSVPDDHWLDSNKIVHGDR